MCMNIFIIDICAVLLLDTECSDLELIKITHLV